MNAYPYLRPWFEKSQLEEIELNAVQVRNRLATARQHYLWSLDVRALIPDAHALHLEKAYDALRAGAGGVVAAHAVRLVGRGRTHEVPFDVAVAALQARRPDVARALRPLTTRLRALRNQIQYESIEEVSAEVCDELFAVLPLIVEAMEAVAYELIRLPAPGGWPRAT